MQTIKLDPKAMLGFRIAGGNAVSIAVKMGAKVGIKPQGS